MQSRTPVEVADQVSRKRAVVVAAAAVAFLAVQLVARPVFVDGPESAHYLTRGVMWAVNAGVLLLGLATGGGILNGRQLRSLVNDEVARSHRRTAVAAGWWVTMAVAMGLYLLADLTRFTARETVYLVVTPSLAVALLAFSWLELRAHRDA